MLSKYYFILSMIFIFFLSNITAYASNERRAQSYLSLSGYYNGKINGKIDFRTKTALTKAYVSFGEKAPDVIDNATIAALQKLYFKKMKNSWSLDPSLSKRMTIADARHFLERTGIGTPISQIQKLISKSRAEAIYELITGYSTNVELALPSFIFEQQPEYWIRWDYNEPERQAFRMARDREISELKLWWVRQMISTQKPQNERLILFWTGHFPVEYSSIDEESISIAKQHMMFRLHGFGNFRDLVKLIIRDPAMLNYLDAERSHKGSPNENFGRELLELFVLGEGNYDEKTVKEASRALTGHSISRIKGFEFRLAPWRQDRSGKNLFGKYGAFDGDDLVDILFEQKQTAKFITEKMWRYYVSETNIDNLEIERIAEQFRKSDYEISVLLAQLFSSSSFWDEQNRGTIIKSPVDLVIGSIRSTGFLPADWTRIPNVLANLGQNIFEPPNVGGWPRGNAWITPANLLNRKKFLIDFFSTQGEGLADLTLENPEISLKRPDTLMIRYGAENFQGAPKFRIFLQKYDNNQGFYKTVWQSHLIKAKSGHDTELFGRIEADQIPWTLATFEINPNINFDQVGVKFANDHCCGPGGEDGGDRNLFIDWAKVSNRLFLAQDGRQSSSCRTKKKYPGHLYCNGTVYMKDNININSTKTPEVKSKKNQLTIERAAFDWGEIHKSNKDWNELMISLLNVRFNNHKQDGMKLKIVSRHGYEFLLELSEFNCSGKCLINHWPNSADIWKNGARSIKLSLGPNENWKHAQQFKQLSEEDQKFVSALWQSIPGLINKMKHGRTFKEEGIEVLPSWKVPLDRMLKRLEKSKFINNYEFPPMTIKKPPNKKINNMMSMAMTSVSNSKPLPNSKNPIQNSNQWLNAISTVVTAAPIHEAILAIPPIFNKSNEITTNLMTDPVFHLK